MSNFYDNYWKDHQHHKAGDFQYKWPAIRHLIPIEPNLRILDFGCGIGEVLKELIKINKSSYYIGIDVSRVALNKARKKLSKIKFYRVNDGEKIPVKKSTVDFVLALDVVEHVYNTKNLYSEFARILKPGGKILITTPYHGILKNLVLIIFFFEQYFNTRGPHIRFYSKKSLIKELQEIKFRPIEFGYFGRFFPFSRAMYVLAEKNK